MDICADFAIACNCVNSNCAMHISYKKRMKQGQKLFKKESDVGMLLTDIDLLGVNEIHYLAINLSK